MFKPYLRKITSHVKSLWLVKKLAPNVMKSLKTALQLQFNLHLKYRNQIGAPRFSFSQLLLITLSIYQSTRIWRLHIRMAPINDTQCCIHRQQYLLLNEIQTRKFLINLLYLNTIAYTSYCKLSIKGILLTSLYELLFIKFVIFSFRVHTSINKYYSFSYISNTVINKNMTTGSNLKFQYSQTGIPMSEQLSSIHLQLNPAALSTAALQPFPFDPGI